MGCNSGDTRAAFARSWELQQPNYQVVRENVRERDGGKVGEQRQSLLHGRSRKYPCCGARGLTSPRRQRLCPNRS